MKKQIPEYSRYQIDTEGKIYDMKNGKIQPTVWNGDFLCTNLIRDDGVKVLCKIHRLMAITFVDNPHNANRVVHKDGDRSNNRVENIAWQPKKVKEAAIKEEKTFSFCGGLFTVSQMSEMWGIDKGVVRQRLKAGWSVVECKLGWRHFTGEGFQTDTHWFPSEKELKTHQWQQELLRRKQMKEEREMRKRERENYKKYGVGVFVNEPIVGIENRKLTRCYMVWDAMLSRCYNTKHANYFRYGGRGVTVCEEWHHFQSFASWYHSRYKEDGWQLDKDILCEQGTPVYCPESCLFVPPEINSFFASLPKGDPFTKSVGDRWMIQISERGDKRYSWYDSQEEAVDAYWKQKQSCADRLASKYPERLDERLINKLSDIIPPKQTHI